MAGEDSATGGNPVGAIIQTFKLLGGRFGGGPREPDQAPITAAEIDRARSIDPEAAREIEAMLARELRAAGRSGNQRRLAQYRAAAAARTVQAPAPGTSASPGIDSGIPAIPDPDLSPVFGIPGAVAAVKYRRVAPGVYKPIKKPSGKVKLPRTTLEKLEDLAKKAIKLAAKRLPKAAALAKKLPKVGKLGGIVPTAIGLGGQVVIDAASRALEKRQFAEMERILKRQQAETNKVVKAARAGPAPRQPVATPKAARKVSQKVARSPAPPPVPKVRPGAIQGPPKSLANRQTEAKSRPKLLPVTTKSPQQPPARRPSPIPKFIGDVLRGAQLLDVLKGSSPPINLASIQEPSPAPQTQPKSGGILQYLNPTAVATAECCPCPKPRKKSTKKRKAPRVCVSQAVAKKAGIKRTRKSAA